MATVCQTTTLAGFTTIIQSTSLIPSAIVVSTHCPLRRIPSDQDGDGELMDVNYFTPDR